MVAMRSERMSAMLRETSTLSTAFATTIVSPALAPKRRRTVVTIGTRRFELLPCPPDGRCFYHAIARAMNALSRARPHTAADVYERVRRAYPEVRAVWAEDEDVMKTARVLRIDVHMWEGVNSRWTRFGEDGHRRVWLFNPANVHYDALLPISGRDRHRSSVHACVSRRTGRGTNRALRTRHSVTR